MEMLEKYFYYDILQKKARVSTWYKKKLEGRQRMRPR